MDSIVDTCIYTDFVEEHLLLIYM